MKDNDDMEFRGMVRTDDISLSILKQNFNSSFQFGFDLNKDVPEAVYVGTLSEQEVESHRKQVLKKQLADVPSSNVRKDSQIS